MFRSAASGTFQATGGVFCVADAAVPDELRVVFESTAATSTVYVRVLTAGDANDVHDYHNRALLAQKVVASVTDGEGTVAATDIDVKSVSVATGTYDAYKLTLARAVTPSEVVGVTVQSPYVRGTLATTADLAPLVAAMPRLEVSVARITSPVPWAPSAAAGVTAPALPPAHALVVGAAVTLHFAFEAQEDFAPGAVASFAATVNGAEMQMQGATVSGKSIVVPFSAAYAAKHTFVFVAFGTMFVFVVGASLVYSYPSIVGTSRSEKSVVTLGEYLPVVSTFDAPLPLGMQASALVTPLGFESEATSYDGVVAGLLDMSFSVLVARDVAHSATVTLSYGGTSRGGYSWGTSTLTAGTIYTFPSSFTVNGSASFYLLQAGSPGALQFTFAGGDMLHSSDVATQVEYVTYTQGGTTSTADVVSCSDPFETVSVASITPADATDVTLRVKLKGPDGALSGEITSTVSSAYILPAWDAVAVTTVLSASVSWRDDTAKRIVGEQLFVYGSPMGAGVWVGGLAFAAWIAGWNGWLLVQFTADTVRTGWRSGDPSYAHTVASIAAATLHHTTYAWSGNLPQAAFGHTLVVDSPVTLDFGFTALPVAITSAASFTATLNGEPLSLASANIVGTSVRVSYKALAAIEHVFVLTALGQSNQFVVPASAVFEFPTVDTTTRLPNSVTLGQSVQLTTSFTSAIPVGATATVVVTPQGEIATPLTATVSGTTVVVSHTVMFDAGHTGAITVTYGPTSKLYQWGTGALTAGSIYTFPSSFTIDGSANGFGSTYMLKAGTPGALQLAFVGGDMLHSSDVAAQVAYVKYTQGVITNTVVVSSCSDPLETVSLSSITPADTSDLTLRVRLKGPDGVLSDEMTATIGSTQISPAWQSAGVTTTSSASVEFSIGAHTYRIVADELFYQNTSYGSGVWVSDYAYAVHIPSYEGWFLAHFSSAPDTVRLGWKEADASYGPTVAKIIDRTWDQDAISWIGNLPQAAFGHTLVVGSAVMLDFGFTALPAGITSAASFTATVNGAVLSLVDARVVGASVRLSYTAMSAIEHVFVFTALGQSSQFVVPASAVFEFPIVGTTSMLPAYVTLGQSVQLTTTFESAMPASATATTVVTPQGQSATPPLATVVSGLSAVVSHTVMFDSLHAGAITVTYGQASKTYNWSASPLTAGYIYTFPSALTVDGSANGYGSTYGLKAGFAGNLQLTFAGGDLLHSASVAAQVSYVSYTQGTTTSPVDVGSLACALPESMSITSLTPAYTPLTPLMTLRVKLKGPDGAPGGEMTANVLIAGITNCWIVAARTHMRTILSDVPGSKVGDVFQMTITGSTTGGPVWGTDIYTHDSAIARAAVHAGVIGAGETKAVYIQLEPGISGYVESTRNGVTTASFGPWGTSYKFIA